MLGNSLQQKLQPSSLYVLCIALNSECWKEISDVHGLGGISYNFTDLADCQAACISSRTCIAIDWEPSNFGKSCWMLTRIFTIETTQHGVITHYELNPACRGQFLFYFVAFAFVKLDQLSLSLLVSVSHQKTRFKRV